MCLGSRGEDRRTMAATTAGSFMGYDDEEGGRFFLGGFYAFPNESFWPG